MHKNEFDNILKDAVNDAELKSCDIPSIDLYVDQIINLQAEKLKEGSTRFYDRQLTKTMINNYAKDRVITPVKGKKYTKEQIIQILTIYTLKGTLSIGEIKRMLHGAYAADGFDGNSLVELYDKYSNSKENTREYAQKIVAEILADNSLDIENDDDYFVAVATISAMSSFMKSIAQAMIDAKYPEPVEESEPEKEKKEKEKKEKKEKKDKKDKKKKTANEGAKEDKDE